MSVAQKFDPFHPEIVAEMFHGFAREDAFALAELGWRYCECGNRSWADYGGLCESCYNRPATYGGESTAEYLLGLLADIHVVLDSATVIESERAEYERKYGVGPQWLVSEDEVYKTARKLFRKALNFTGR